MDGRSTARHVQGYASVRVNLMLCSLFLNGSATEPPQFALYGVVLQPPKLLVFCEVSQPQKFPAVGRVGNVFIFCCSVPAVTCGVMRVAEQRVTVA
jgi:hypothetical protein